MSKRNRRATGILDQGMNEINNTYCSRYSSQYVPFMTHLSEKAKKQGNLISTANGATVYAGTDSVLVDFNARATELRNASEKLIGLQAASAYAEDPVRFVKLLFQTGDIRCGKGERRIFNVCMDWLVANHPMVAIEVLPLISEYTRWDYLVRLTVSADKEVSKAATDIVVSQLLADKACLDVATNVEAGADAARAEDCANVHISLLAKWMPSLQTKRDDHKVIVRHLLRSLHMQEREYRQLLSALREHLNIIEKYMSAKDLDRIDMEKLTSKQQLRYAAFLKKTMAEKRHAYIQAVLRGEKKMNASVLNPLDIYHEYLAPTSWNSYYAEETAYNEDFEALWSMLPDNTNGNGNTLVIRDGSGSMTDSIGQGSSATMLDAASAMAIYCAERMSGAFHNKFITFSRKPQLVDMAKCETLADKINYLKLFDDCSNTNLEATFDLILDVAVENHLSQDEIPAYLMILSDMEFDAARGAYYLYKDRDTLFSVIRDKWEKAGYDMPTLVFWQLNGRRTVFPEIDAKNGIIFLSGYSTNELKLVMAGEYERYEEVTEEVEVVDELTGETKTVVQTSQVKVVLSPQEQLELKLSDARYDAVEEAVKRGLAREAA